MIVAILWYLAGLSEGSADKPYCGSMCATIIAVVCPIDLGLFNADSNGDFNILSALIHFQCVNCRIVVFVRWRKRGWDTNTRANFSSCKSIAARAGNVRLLWWRNSKMKTLRKIHEEDKKVLTMSQANHCEYGLVTAFDS